jgi:hypothetical protein
MVHLHFFVNGEMRGVLILTPEEFGRFRRSKEKVAPALNYTFVKGKLTA